MQYDFFSFIVGFLLGMIVMLLIVWLAYSTRTAMFSYCPRNPPICRGNDYYNNPGEALTNGYDINRLLYINDKGEMYYRRVTNAVGCIPDQGQTIHIRYPQYCQFKDQNGSTVAGKSIYYGSNIYKLQNGTSTSVQTLQDCVPNDSETFYYAGRPLLKWDPAVLQN